MPLASILKYIDPQIYSILQKEDQRQEESLEMIASENFVSSAVLEACSSTLTNKYAEGYPQKRYYNGCKNADEVENLAIDRLKELFSCEFANVQAHSGSNANMAALFSLIEPNDTILGMDLSHGGHLTHGSRVNFSGKYYNVVSYGVREKDELIDYDDLYQKAREHKPKLIIAGFSAYSRVLDFTRFREIADEIGAYLLADIAHIAGLVATQEHPSPVGLADIITSTTHKTLRGPRGGILLTNNPEHAKRMNSLVFPGVQGGPLLHIIGAKAVAFQEALQPEFRTYVKKVKKNAKILAEGFLKRGHSVLSGGTDNHIVVLSLRGTKITGAVLADALDKIGITANKNSIPFDPHPPRITSGVRFGSAALTTRGLGEKEFDQLANCIARLVKNLENEKVQSQLRAEIQELCDSYPMTNFHLPWN